MKKRINILLIIIITLFLTGCGNKYEGYWCTYDEVATIVVLLEDDYTEAEKAAIAERINNYENVESMNFYTKEDYANQMNQDPNTMDIYETFIVTFNSMDNIGTYVEELGKLNGVLKSEQSYAKNNIALYYIDGWGKYTFTNSDEATDKDLEKGKYKEKNGVLIFKPTANGTKQKMLYPKDNYLCGDAACNKIYAKSNETCSTK